MPHAQTDNRVLQQLRGNIAGGFDEEKFGSHIGFSNLKTYAPLVATVKTEVVT